MGRFDNPELRILAPPPLLGYTMYYDRFYGDENKDKASWSNRPYGELNLGWPRKGPISYPLDHSSRSMCKYI